MSDCGHQYRPVLRHHRSPRIHRGPRSVEQCRRTSTSGYGRSDEIYPQLETKAHKHLLNPSDPTKFLSDQEIKDNADLNVPDQFKEQCLKLLQKHRKVISVSKTDLGLCKTSKHRLYLKDDQPVYHKQFPLKPDHQTFVEQSFKEWLRLGVVQKTNSSYISPIICVPKKGGGGLRIVQDFRGLTQDPH